MEWMCCNVWCLGINWFGEWGLVQMVVKVIQRVTVLILRARSIIMLQNCQSESTARSVSV